MNKCDTCEEYIKWQMMFGDKDYTDPNYEPKPCLTCVNNF